MSHRASTRARPHSLKVKQKQLIDCVGFAGVEHARMWGDRASRMRRHWSQCRLND